MVCYVVFLVGNERQIYLRELIDVEAYCGALMLMLTLRFPQMEGRWPLEAGPAWSSYGALR